MSGKFRLHTSRETQRYQVGQLSLTRATQCRCSLCTCQRVSWPNGRGGAVTEKGGVEMFESTDLTTREKRRCRSRCRRRTDSAREFRRCKRRCFRRHRD
jgi:hypothetical protein